MVRSLLTNVENEDTIYRGIQSGHGSPYITILSAL